MSSATQKDEVTSRAARSQHKSALVAFRPNFVQRIDAHIVFLALILLIAAVLRFSNLDRTIWLDEAVSWVQASAPSFLEMLKATARDNYPPLHNAILYITIKLFGDSEVAMRIPSALLGIGTVYLLYRLGELLWDRTTGLIAALLLAVSGFHVWYSGEVRMYALLAFTSTLFILMAVLAMRRPNWMTLGGCAAAGTALLYSHLYGTFLFIGVNALVLVMLMTRASGVHVRLGSWMVSQALAFLPFAPWAIILYWRAQTVTATRGWTPEPTPKFVFDKVSEVAGGSLALILLGILAVLSFLDFARLSTEKKATKRIRADWRTALVLTWFAAPLLIGYVVAVILGNPSPSKGPTGQNILHQRYFICVLPALLLLAARGAGSFAQKRETTALITAVAVAVSLPAWTNERARPSHKLAMQEFSARSLPDDQVYFIRYSRTPSLYYYRKPLTHATEFEEINQIPPGVTNLDRFWLVLRSDSHDKNLYPFLSQMNKSHHIKFKINNLIYLFEKRDKTTY